MSTKMRALSVVFAAIVSACAVAPPPNVDMMTPPRMSLQNVGMVFIDKFTPLQGVSDKTAGQLRRDVLEALQASFPRVTFTANEKKRKQADLILYGNIWYDYSYLETKKIKPVDVVVSRDRNGAPTSWQGRLLTLKVSGEAASYIASIGVYDTGRSNGDDGGAGVVKEETFFLYGVNNKWPSGGNNRKGRKAYIKGLLKQLRKQITLTIAPEKMPTPVSLTRGDQSVRQAILRNDCGSARNRLKGLLPPDLANITVKMYEKKKGIDGKTIKTAYTGRNLAADVDNLYLDGFCRETTVVSAESYFDLYALYRRLLKLNPQNVDIADGLGRLERRLRVLGKDTVLRRRIN